MNAGELCGIYAIVDPASHTDVGAFARALLDGGIRLIQLRDKRGVERAAVDRLQMLCAAGGATLIVNDDVALACRAGGVHLGQEDLAGKTIAQIRAEIGPRIIGVSASTPREAQAAFAGGADYLGTGPYHPTSSKADAGKPIGLAGLSAVVRATPLPVAAIGGITIEDLPAIVRSGARMAAVISALAAASDPREAARALVRRWEELTA